MSASNTAEISGTLTDGTGQPVAGASVILDAGAESIAVSNDEGQFKLTALPGLHSMVVSMDGVVLHTEIVKVKTKKTKAVDLELGYRQVLATVSGFAVDGSGNPVVGAIIEMHGPFEQDLVTGSDGMFQAQLASGSYSFFPSWQGYDAEPGSFEISAPNNLEIGSVQVLVELIGTYVDGLLNPIEGAAVSVFTSPDVLAYTGPDGSFSVQVPTGTHNMIVALDGLLLVQEAVSVGGPALNDLGTQQVLVNVTGRVIDEQQQPVAGAEVVVDTAPLTIRYSQADGTFAVSLPLETLRLCVGLNGVTVASELMQIATWVSQGAIGLDPIVAMPMGDIDFDGLGDAFEFEGWTILVDETGSGDFVERSVYSDPVQEDTDGDMLNDAEEFALKTDPNRADTDGDLLDDSVEIHKYLSHPAMVDTDGDALALDGEGIPNPAFFDGYEVNNLRTSPTLDDTDGDGIRDHEEIVEGGTSALIANLPQIAIEVFGEPIVGFTGDVDLLIESIQTAIENDTNASTSSNEFNFGAGASLDTKVKTEASYGFPLGGSASIEGEATLKANVNTDYAYHTTNKSSKEMTTNVQEMLSMSENYTAGKIEVALEIKNNSDLTIRYKDLEVIVFQLDPLFGGSGLKPLGQLEFDGLDPTDGVLLGPQGSVTLLAGNDELDLLRVRSYMTNPTGLYFRIGDFALFQLDDEGNAVIDYDVVAQKVVERTALLVIDWGDGTSDRYSIATNVERDSDGTPLGLRMADAMAILDLEFDTEGATDGPNKPASAPSKQDVQVLTKLDGRANEAVETFPGSGVVDPLFAKRYWVIQGPGAVDEFNNMVVDFGEIRLKPGEAYHLQFVTDNDLDGLTLQQEKIYGTSDNQKDSDGDGLSDFEEVVTGWRVAFEYSPTNPCGLTPPQVAVLTYPVRSNPRIGDVDGDGLFDEGERKDMVFDKSVPPEFLYWAGLDPFLADTDGDGVLDMQDDFNDPCGVGGSGGIAGGIRVHLTMNEGSYSSSPSRLGDQSGLGNHANVLGTNAVVTQLDTNGVFSFTDTTSEEGFQWAKNEAGLSNEALHFVNDDPYAAPFPSNGTVIDICDGGDAALQILRDQGVLPPAMNAGEDGEGWTWVIRYRKDYNGTPATAGTNCTITWNHNASFSKAAVLASQPGFVSLYDGGGVSNLYRLRFEIQVDGNTVELMHDENVVGFATAVVTVQRVGADIKLRLWMNGILVDNRDLLNTSLPNPSVAGPGAASIWLGWNDYDPSQGKEQENHNNNGASFFGLGGFNGTIDEFRIYDNVLSEDDIKAL